MLEFSEHLRGPWTAFFVTNDGVYTSVDEADLVDADSVVIVRGESREAALRGDVDDDVEPDERDLLYVLEEDDFEDWAGLLPVVWERAQAVAEALNARYGTNEPGA